MVALLNVSDHSDEPWRDRGELVPETNERSQSVSGENFPSDEESWLFEGSFLSSSVFSFSNGVPVPGRAGKTYCDCMMGHN